MNEMSLSIVVCELKGRLQGKFTHPNYLLLMIKTLIIAIICLIFKQLDNHLFSKAMFHLGQTGLIIFIIKLALNHDFAILANNHNRWHINAIKPIFLNHRISSGIAKSDFVTNL